MAALTLRGRFDARGEAEEVLVAVLSHGRRSCDIAPEHASALLENFYRHHRDHHDAAFARGLQPDVLGEHVVLRVLEHKAHNADSWLNIAFAGADAAALENAFVVLGRLGTRLIEPSDRVKVEGWLRSILITDLPARALYAFFAARALGSSTALGSVADIVADQLEAAPASQVLDVARLILTGLDRMNPTPISLRRLGVVCGQALVKTLRANPDHDKAELAHAVNILGNMLSVWGQREKALDATKEAVNIYQELARTRPDAFLSYLAGSLSNLGKMLSDLGQLEPALEAIQKAVDIYRELALTHPKVLPYLAASLNNLGNVLSDLGQLEPALETSQKAVDIRRELARVRPKAFLPDLATSLGNLGSSLSDMGRLEPALDATEEAVDIYRHLARIHPDAFLPGLARTLGVYGLALSTSKRADATVAVFAEALQIIVPLARRLPAVFQRLTLDLAHDLRKAAEAAGPKPPADLLAEVAAIYGDAAQ